MKVEFMPRAQRDLRAYVYHVAADNPLAAMREQVRIRDVIAQYASSPLGGRVVIVKGLSRPVSTWFVYPFHVYYERRGDVFAILRLYHHARQPIERAPR